MNPLLETALEFLANGIAPVPVAADGTKRPALKGWKQYMAQRPTVHDVHEWFGEIRGGAGLGIGIITGAVSGNLEMAEIEGRAGGVQAVLDLSVLANSSGLGEVWEAVCNGWVERSPSGGIHWFYRLTDGPVPGNQKIAKLDPKTVLAETRGEGGFVVTSPSAGYVHETGQSWDRLAGGPETVPALTMEERDAFLSILATLAPPAPEPAGPDPDAFINTPANERPRNADGGISPLDDFEARTDWADILVGWTLVFTHGRTRYWRRPGKRLGISATTGNAQDRDRLYVFTTSTEFEADTPYTKGGAYAVMHHGGDHKAAAAQLKKDGFGKTPPPKQRDVQPAPQPAPMVGAGFDGNLATVHDIAERRQPERTLEQSDDGNALALIETHGSVIRYSPERDKWLHWTGNVWTWQPKGGGTVRELAKQIARNLADRDTNDVKHKKYSLSAVGISNMLTQARTDPRVTVRMDDLDSHPWELNTPGGIINLQTGQLMSPDPSRLHTRLTSCTPDFSADRTVWEAFLADAFPGNGELIAYMQRLIGYSSVGKVEAHVLPFCFGDGGNGKGATLEAIAGILGDYATSAPSGFLMAKKFESHSTEIADLAGARFVLCSEINKDDKFDEAKVKLLTGGDTLKARFMAKDFFTFTPTHHLWLMGNHRPDVEAGGDGFWRRLRLIPFIHKVPDDRIIPDLQQILIREHGPAILAWIAEGAAAYARDGLMEPDQVKAATAAYAAEMDSVGRFLDDECWTGPAAAQMSVRVSQLRAAYESWCQENGDVPMTGRAFTAQLQAHGIETGRNAPRLKGARMYGGVGLRAKDDGAGRAER